MINNKNLDIADYCRVINNIEDNIGLSFAVTLDALFSHNSNVLPVAISKYLYESRNYLSSEKLDGIILAYMEWQITNTIPGDALDFFLKLVCKRAPGGDDSEARWIKSILDLLSLCHSSKRLKILINLAVSRNSIPESCVENYLKTIKRGVLIESENSDAYLHLKNGSIAIIDNFHKAQENERTMAKGVLSILSESSGVNISQKINPILFVHGLSGDRLATWGDFPALIGNDPDFNHINCSPRYYEYITKLWKAYLPYTQKMCDIETLAEGLKEFVYNYIGDDNDITIVCHSLGGLVVKQFLLEEEKSGNMISQYRVIFYSTPHKGTELAKIGSLFSLGHKHMKELCANSTFLKQLTKDWLTLKMKDKIDYINIYGDQDQVVSKESARENCEPNSFKVIQGSDHRSIVKPKSHNDLAYILFKKYLLNPN